MNTNSGTLEPLLGKDPEVFMESVVGDYGKKIYNFAYRMTGNPQDAEDMVQETFLRVYRSLDSFRGECNFSTWIYRIAANLCTDKFRRMRKRPLSIDFPINNEDDRLRYEIPDDSPSPAEMAEMSELKECIMQAINNLPEDQRSVAILRDVQGLKYEEVAYCLAIPVGTVKSRLNRARLTLRTELSGVIESKDAQQVKPDGKSKRTGAFEGQTSSSNPSTPFTYSQSKYRPRGQALVHPA
jgi:RNA polymerase sigma-70 factor (ECF subfamily)